MKSHFTIILAFLYTTAIVWLGYELLGLVPMFLFGFGFFGGLLVWLARPRTPAFATIRIPFYVALLLFVLHKLEERYLDFFPALSEITGVPVPDTNSLLVYLLYALAAAWLLIPQLLKHGSEFGHYLAWSFFTSMGVTELAHFVFPLFTGAPYGYFPGMASTLLLAPVAWWGMWRLWQASS
jgi:hypothetical protein